MSDITGSPQPALSPASPVAGPTPQIYMSGAGCVTLLAARYPRYQLAPGVTPGDGEMLAASMALDEEGPWFGVKLDPLQDREWPRTFAFDWQTVLASPQPQMLGGERPGVYLLDYEGVVPQQVADWVCLEAWRMYAEDQLKVVTSESVSGASVKYAPDASNAKGLAAGIDRLQSMLVEPFQRRAGHLQMFPFGRI